jgi:hypothetical protein
MYEFEIVNDNGQIDWITCKNRTEAIETYRLIYGFKNEYVKKHCIIRKRKYVKRKKQGRELN